MSETVALGEAVQMETKGGAAPSPSPVTLPALEQEITNRKNEDAAFKQSLAATTADFNGKNTQQTEATGTVATNLASEVKAREKSDAAASTATKSVDGKVAALSEKQETENGAVVAAASKLDTALTTETQNREADTKSTNAALDTAIKGVDTKIKAATDGIETEQTKLTDAVTASTTELSGKVTSVTSALSTEVEQRKEADAQEKSTIAGVKAQLSTIVTALQDVQQGKALDIAAIQSAMAKAETDAAAATTAPAKESAQSDDSEPAKSS